MELLRRFIGPGHVEAPAPLPSAAPALLGPLGFQHEGLLWVVVIKEGRDGRPMIHTPTSRYTVPPGIDDRAALRRHVENAFERQYISDAYPSPGAKRVPGFRGYPAHRSLLQSRALLREMPFVQPASGFAGEREAVLAYGRYLVGLSKRSEVEFGAELSKTADGRFLWGRTIAGNSGSVTVDHSLERAPRRGSVVTHMHLHDLTPGMRTEYQGRQAFSTADLLSMRSLLPRADGSTVIYNVDGRTGDVLKMTLDAKGREAVKNTLVEEGSLGGLAQTLLCNGHLRVALVAEKPGSAPRLPLGIYHDSADSSGYVVSIPHSGSCPPLSF